MKDNNPVVVQALSVSGAIIVAKSLLALVKAHDLLGMSNPEVEAAWMSLIDNALPILIIWIGALWAARRTTNLKNPKDVDGTPLSRPDNSPTIPQLSQLQSEAIKMNKGRQLE